MINAFSASSVEGTDGSVSNGVCKIPFSSASCRKEKKVFSYPAIRESGSRRDASYFCQLFVHITEDTLLSPSFPSYPFIEVYMCV